MSKKVTTLAQLRKEVKAAKAFTFEVEKDFVLVFEDFNYFEDDHQDRFLEKLDLVNGGAGSFLETVRAGDDLLDAWLGGDVATKLREVVPKRAERLSIASAAIEHFQAEHGADDPKES